MKLKPCLHPEDHVRQLEDGGAWCSLCGAIRNGDGALWKLPGTMADPKRYVIAEPFDLPPHSDRRAWETFAAGLSPLAYGIIAQEIADATAEEKYARGAELAGLLADRLMGEWAQRFSPKEPT